MNKSFFYRDFKYWLKRNRSKFLVEPYIAHVRKDQFRVYFRGCKGLIYLKVDRWGEFSIWSYFKSELVKMHYEKHYSDRYQYEGALIDWVESFDTSVWREDNGKYFCEFCSILPDRHREYYKSRSDLMIDHCYSPFLEWCNEVLAKSDCIAFYECYTEVGVRKEILNAPSKRGLNSIDQVIYVFDIPKRTKFKIIEGEEPV
ncbi:hypothetical protein [Halobacteriovorax sp. HLS]|uniref:hypothetical protein n=1 Tax=Halobacteriovorax sp. HLS TaxID=2234000 RepID=UPI000FDCA231|nr:hypothetical protein [Halobacteriovorax sp. HLS]